MTKNKGVEIRKLINETYPAKFKIHGLDVIIAKSLPLMQCSHEFSRLQHPDLVKKTNEWMASFFGYNELLPGGEVIHLVEQKVLMMNEKTLAQARAILCAEA